MIVLTATLSLIYLQYYTSIVVVSITKINTKHVFLMFAYNCNVLELILNYHLLGYSIILCTVHSVIFRRAQPPTNTPTPTPTPVLIFEITSSNISFNTPH